MQKSLCAGSVMGECGNRLWLRPVCSEDPGTKSVLGHPAPAEAISSIVDDV